MAIGTPSALCRSIRYPSMTPLVTVGLDVEAVSHEAAEWMNDPAFNNKAPSWGNIGQVSGCFGFYEVGDPLTGHTASVLMPNGKTYHPQEMAFISWFYRLFPSLGPSGLYSNPGTFKGYSKVRPPGRTN
jgi:hypothetical protein